MKKTNQKHVNRKLVENNQLTSTATSNLSESIIENAKQRLIVVLGMHRSGTSAIARGLTALDVRLGDTLIGTLPGVNDKGFWEDVDLNSLDVEMLAALGSDWHHLSAIQQDDIDVLRNKGFFLRAVELLRKKTNGMPVFGFKDPRVAKLLPFWKEVFRHCQFDVGYVLALRHPLSVVKSLAKRDGFDAEKTYFLWLNHVITSLEWSRGSKRTVIDYDLLMQAPEYQLNRLAKQFDLNINSDELNIYKTEFLDKNLQHTVYRLEDLSLDEGCPLLVHEVYAALLDLASDKGHIDDSEFQKKVELWATEFNRIKALLRLTDRFCTKTNTAIQTITERDNQISQLNQAITKRDNQISQLDQAVIERDDQIHSLNQTVIERDDQIHSLNQAVIERDDQIHSLNQAVIERDDQIHSLNQAVIERDDQIHSLNQAVIERDDQIHSLNQAVIERKEQFASMNRAVADRDGKIASLSHALIESNKQIIEIRSSTSWRLTLPLRFVGHQVKRIKHLIKILPDILHIGGGIKATACKTYTAFRREGFDGLKQKLRSLQPVTRVEYEEETGQKQNQQTMSLLPDATPADAEQYAFSQLRVLESYVSDRFLSANSRVTRSSYYVPKATDGLDPNQLPIKTIAFYLPQFHPIPENDVWWGKGFTEWTNVSKAQPQFLGHYQPHLPGELGFYDLRLPETMHQQVELARKYGISAFCFHYYWFGGKRLLELPINNFLADPSMNIDFCFCWANENWSRRWDGSENDILMAQNHSPEDDISFIETMAPAFSDPRYIKIDDKPLLIVYRASLLPNAAETAARWRKRAQEMGFPGLYLVAARSFDITDPRPFDFDAAVEFPPHQVNALEITSNCQIVNPNYRGRIFDYKNLAERYGQITESQFVNFKTVMPSWDNEARKPGEGHTFAGASPETYARWLAFAVQTTLQRRPEERLLFINAWNEWAEGAHLEPDRYYGYAYLQATKDVLSGIDVNHVKKGRKVVLVVHDAFPSGAQYLALNLAKTLNQEFGFHVDLVCLADGPLVTEYAKWATLHNLAGLDARGPEAIALARKLYALGNRSALVNTTVSGYFLETLADNGFECVALIHELRGVLDQYDLHAQAKAIAEHATRIVFPAEEVAASFRDVAPMDAAKIVIKPQGLYKRRKKSLDRIADRKILRQQLELPDECQIVLGVGHVDLRKGIDLFVEAGLIMAQRFPLVHWVWVGHWDETIRIEIDRKLDESPSMKDRFRFPGRQSNTDLFYGGADVFALTSREDPFPSVVLEALDAELPVVGFEGAGGFVGLLNEGCGRLVAMEDTVAFADAVATLLETPQDRESLGRRGAELISERFSFRHYIFDLLDYMGIGLERVSVVVPNFNYAQYLPERLSSITTQSYPVYEIIFLDDCSMDHSVKVAREILEAQPIDFNITVNKENSGSVFTQWKKGLDHARGTYIWIAEADDSCSSNFMCEVMHGFENPDVVLSYCESKQMDEDGKILANNYQTYVADIGAERWTLPYVKSGHEEATEALSIKNTIPNVSGVVFKKDALKSVLNHHIDLIRTYRVAGDWLVYVLLLKCGKIAFSPASLNMHRRHNRGVTLGSFNTQQLDEIQRMQAFVAEEFEVPHDKKVVASKYIQRLSKQFGIDSR